VKRAAQAPAPAPADLALDALAEALAPRVLALLQKRAENDDGTAALAELLQGTGYEVES
jgi:hypothetical protein